MCGSFCARCVELRIGDDSCWSDAITFIDGSGYCLEHAKECLLQRKHGIDKRKTEMEQLIETLLK